MNKEILDMFKTKYFNDKLQYLSKRVNINVNNIINSLVDTDHKITYHCIGSKIIFAHYSKSNLIDKFFNLTLYTYLTKKQKNKVNYKLEIYFNKLNNKTKIIIENLKDLNFKIDIQNKITLTKISDINKILKILNNDTQTELPLNDTNIKLTNKNKIDQHNFNLELEKKNKLLLESITNYILNLSMCFKLTDSDKKELTEASNKIIEEIVNFMYDNSIVDNNFKQYLENIYKLYLDMDIANSVSSIACKYILTNLKVFFTNRIAYFNTTIIKKNKIIKKHYLRWPKQYTQTLHCQSKEIAYSHVLPFYPGKCKYLHGHNGRLDLDITTHIKRLDYSPLLVSFSIAKKLVNQIHEMLDHKFIWNLNPNYPVEIIKDDTKYYKYYIKIVTDLQQLILPFTKNSIVLIPPSNKKITNDNCMNYATSENILKNYIIKQCIKLLYDKHLYWKYNTKEISDIDLFESHGIIQFKWWESNSTNIIASYMI